MSTSVAKCTFVVCAFVTFHNKYVVPCILRGAILLICILFITR